MEQLLNGVHELAFQLMNMGGKIPVDGQRFFDGQFKIVHEQDKDETNKSEQERAGMPQSLIKCSDDSQRLLA